MGSSAARVQSKHFFRSAWRNSHVHGRPWPSGVSIYACDQGYFSVPEKELVGRLVVCGSHGIHVLYPTILGIAKYLPWRVHDSSPVEPRFDSPTAEPDRAPTVPDSPDSPDRCQSTVPTCPNSTLPQKFDTDHASLLSSTVKLSSTLPAARHGPTARQFPTVPDSARQLDRA